MTPERWSLLKSIVEQIESAPAPARSALLAAFCQDDPTLLSDIQPYLTTATTDPFLHSLIASQAAAFGISPQQRFGHYQLVARIGQGGMGAVYEASRIDDFHKKVALKIIRQGLDSEFARARFLHERQTLASLEHPYIARLLDGGESEDGSPYLVMEFIEGQVITDFASTLDTPARLRLFLKVCEAVGHAHRNLIIHRDLKPANILVTPAGDPKLLDFGIAKLLSPDSAATQTVLALTPDYASPEQVRAQPISTASDVYSLGVILYQILTGRKPYTLSSATAIEMDRVICIAPPAPPNLGGDLDDILLMALRKEPERRYASVERFAEDIERYLTHRPIRARPDTAWYRVRKYGRRNWPALTAATAIAATLFIALALNLAEQRRTARRFNQVRQLSNRFLFDFHDEIAPIPGTVKAREMIVSTALQYLNTLTPDAKNDPTLQWEIASAYAKVAKVQGSTTSPSLRRPADAVQSFAKAVALGRPLFEQNRLTEPQRIEFVDLLCDAETIARSLRRPDAPELGREAVAKSVTLTPYIRNRALGELAITLGRIGDIAGSASTLQTILTNSREIASSDPTFDNRRRVAVTLFNLSSAEGKLTEFSAAHQHAAEALASLQQLAAERPKDTRMSRWIFLVYTRLADNEGAGDSPSLQHFDKAGILYEQAIATMQPLIDADVKDLASRNDAGLDHVRAAYALAETNPTRALTHASLAAQLLDEASPNNLDFRAQPHIAAANAYRALKQFDLAAAKLKSAEDILVSPDSDTRADLNLAAARLHQALGHPGDALTYFTRALEIDEALYTQAPTPANAWALARTLQFAGPTHNERILAIWKDQNSRYPNHPYLQQQLAAAR